MCHQRPGGVRHASVASKKTELGSGHVNADSCTGQAVIGYVNTGVWRVQRATVCTRVQVHADDRGRPWVCNLCACREKRAVVCECRCVQGIEEGMGM